MNVSTEQRKVRRLPDLTIVHLWPLGVMALIFFFLSTHPIRPHDFWWHLRAGQQILSTGHIPTIDTFSYTQQGLPYDNYASFWMMESAYYLLYSLGGAALVVFTHSVTISAAYGLVLGVCWRESGNWRMAAVATLFAALLGFNDWNVRPQAIAFLIGALYLWGIYGYRRQPRAWLLVLFPLGMLIWANSHGSFAIGFLMLGVWWVDELWQAARSRLHEQRDIGWRRVIAPTIALSSAGLACLVNPRGLGIVNYVTGMSGNPIIRNLVPEWAPPSFDTQIGTIFLIGLLLSAAILAVSPKRPSVFQLITFLGFATLALRTNRGVVWFGLVMAPVLADHLAAIAAQIVPAKRQSAPTRIGVRWINYLFAGVLLLGCVLALPWFKTLLPLPPLKAGLLSTETPIAATRYLVEQELPQPVFNHLAFGSYLIWAAYPEVPVFVDTRLELYPPELWLEYLQISSAQEDWEERLSRYGIQTLMLSPHGQSALIAAARQSPHWRVVYEDSAAVLLERKNSELD